ncbi:MAG: hypothetical protein UV60_C0012G0029 [Parcubacteria group bacterium GW2011_GWA2_43_11]|nr:MAG: hypothetical protein UU89_C0007G0011 [Parcubacteria group bacterium GW2011_GWC2_42_11]KKS85037.1 MAG: hypothetical protein UV60_C0012G0029 [Parcubacteria group bacterium GW2011_GWA2_43_11]
MQTDAPQEYFIFVTPSANKNWSYFIGALIKWNKLYEQYFERHFATGPVLEQSFSTGWVTIKYAVCINPNKL